jgi:hypothetical protein
MMHIGFTTATSDATGKTLMIVAVEHHGANLLPTELLRLRGIGDGYLSTANRTRDGETKTFSVHHQMFTAVGAIKGDVSHWRCLASGKDVVAGTAGQAASCQRLDELFQSLLHRAFAGEL